MPIWLRKFTFEQIRKTNEAQNQQKGGWDDPSVKQAGQEQKRKISPPSYVTKASKK